MKKSHFTKLYRRLEFPVDVFFSVLTILSTILWLVSGHYALSAFYAALAVSFSKSLPGGFAKWKFQRNYGPEPSMLYQYRPFYRLLVDYEHRWPDWDEQERSSRFEELQKAYFALERDEAKLSRRRRFWIITLTIEPHEDALEAKYSLYQRMLHLYRT